VTKPVVVPAIPKASDLTVRQAAQLAARIERWAPTTDDIAALNEERDKLDTFASWLRDRHEASATELLRASRILDVRVGELLGDAKATQGRRTDLSQACDKSPIPKDDRVRLRKIHANAHLAPVAAAIERGVTRTELLRTIDETKAAARREALEVELAEGREEVRKLNARYQPPGFDRVREREVVRQRGEFSRLCRDLGALPAPKTFVRTHQRYLTAEYINEAERAHRWLAGFLETWRTRS